MELTVQKNELLRELQLTQGVVERKTTIPILGNLLLEASGEGLQIALFVAPVLLFVSYAFGAPMDLVF
ncbi:MAG: hypothetical protein L0099_13960, partial [Acidobacteria bacterium]|nr:hypothetical protein [Acidobacteriota bacterium]